uniref:Gelsolin n=3 Tax=Macrostomum lignano TaxID=282301 RepID=A0A1I8GIF7_9PLAT
MNKPKQYDWKDSNLALFGSDTERQVKKESAEKEPAWKPVLEAQKPQLYVWRIENFKVVEWPRDLYGKFYSGDSYIILNAYMEADKLCYDVHFWIGKESTADEYGTAAYKTVELDTLLDDLPVQHREVQGHESALMRSYFPEITYLAGGCPSGFRNVTTREYKPRLLHVRGERQNIVVTEVPRSRKALDNTDVYILDLGDRAIQWNGSGANKNEKFKAAQYLSNLKSERNGRLAASTLEEDGTPTEHEFYTSLTDEEVERDSASGGSPGAQKRMMKLSDATGKLNFDLVSTDSLSKSNITEDDVFIIDNGFEVYVYVGENASLTERHNALAYAHNYLRDSVNPLLPVTVVTPQAPAKTKAAFNAVF